MEIIGVEVAGGPQVVSFLVPHGIDPRVLLFERGWSLRRWLSATTTAEDVVLMTAQVAPVRDGMIAPVNRTRSTGRHLSPTVVKQRVAAYAIALSTRGLLATCFSKRTAVPDTWGLPGGGRETGEHLATTLLREIQEETGQTAQILRLLDVQSDHWVGRSPTGQVEDFHALRVVYAATVPEPTDPIVHDVGGTTSAARWVKPACWRRLSWSGATRILLEAHLLSLQRELGLR